MSGNKGPQSSGTIDGGRWTEFRETTLSLTNFDILSDLLAQLWSLRQTPS
jgi:hypothetical protein